MESNLLLKIISYNIFNIKYIPIRVYILLILMLENTYIRNNMLYYY